MCPLSRAPLKPETARRPRAAAPAAERLDRDEARQARIERLRLQLASGTYRPSLERIAERMLTSGDLG